MSVASRAILSNFFEEQGTQNYPQYLSGLSRALFPTTFLEIPVYETLITTWDYTGRNLEIACNKLSSIKKMCSDLFSEETCDSILVSGHLP